MIVALAFLAQTALVPIPYTSPNSGTPLENAKKFADLCSASLKNEGPPEFFGICYGYLEGLIDRDDADDRPMICMPASRNKLEVMESVIDFIEKSPDASMVSVKTLVLLALAKAYPAIGSRQSCVIRR